MSITKICFCLNFCFSLNFKVVKAKRLVYNRLMNDIWNYLKNTDKPIVLYGMGNGADKIIKVLEEKEIKYAGVFVSDGFVRDKTFHGMKLMSYADAVSRYQNMVVLMCFGSALNDVIDNVKRIAAQQELFAPDVPVYGTGLFDKQYYVNHKADFDFIYEKLSDEKSKQTFNFIVDYKISGRIDKLFECEVEKNEPYGNFFLLNDQETFLDLGAYRGDTVKEFIDVVSSYTKIIAVEPDKKTFSKLCENLKESADIELLNVCIGDTVGKIPFSSGFGRGSSAVKTGEFADCVTVDSILGGNEVTYIKADIEGEEVPMINGASYTIKKYKPKMRIVCYHRTGDLIDIPKAVLSIRDDYKIYLRHFPSLPAWDTEYFFI